MDACGRQQKEEQIKYAEKIGRAFHKADDRGRRSGSSVRCNRVYRYEQTEENTGEKKTESEK